MKTMKFTYWQHGGYYLGFWNEYPDYNEIYEQLAKSIIKKLAAD